MSGKYNISYKFINKLSGRKGKSKIQNFNDCSDEQRKENLLLLERCSQAWMSLYDFRKEARRLMRYRDGKQWSDLMDGVDDKGIKLTEEDYIISQGKVPLKNNLISSIVRNVIGVFRSNKTEPEVIARNSNDPKLGEMMSVALQYVHQSCDVNEIDAEALSELLITGFTAQIVRYDWVTELQDNDITVDNVDRNCVFMVHNFNNGRQNDVSLFGMFEDLDRTTIITRYSHSKAETKKLLEIYDHCNREDLSEYFNGQFTDFDNKTIDFYTPVRQNLCRVIHVWELRNKEVLWCHDPLEGKVVLRKVTEEDKVKAENARRTVDGLANGLSMEEIEANMLIRYRYRVSQEYYVKHLSPRGDVLWEGENPYDHHSLPFVFLMHPFHDGEIHSFVGDFIDQQRYINRLVMMIDFMMSSSAKSLLIFPVDCLGEMTKEEVIDEYIKTNGVIFARQRPGASMPTELTSKVNYMGATELLNIQLSLLNRVSGVHESMQGMQAKAGTAASLYAQESQNSASNILDVLEAFNSFRKRRDTKIMKTIQQYYRKPKYLNIVGHEYEDDVKMYDPEKVRDIMFDTAITESTATPAYRMAMNNMLMQLLQMGGISAKTMLKGSTLPYKDKILTLIEKEEQEAQAMQQGLQQQQSPELVKMQEEMAKQLGTDSNPEVDKMIKQALE